MLGSPVARSNAQGSVLNRSRYEPYGAMAHGFTPNRPFSSGFTGHVNDADTGLVYMQQRYYDSIAGRFLSVDPVVTDTETGGFFGRYHYANDNPYLFVDPYGREPATGSRLSGGPACGETGGCRVASGTPAVSGEGRILTNPGHHQVPNQVVQQVGITSAAAIKVLDGPEARIPVENHNGAKPSPATINHQQYNKLALAETQKWLLDNKVNPAKMTGGEARALLEHFKTNAPNEIRQFNQVQWSRALHQALHRAWRTNPAARAAE